MPEWTARNELCKISKTKTLKEAVLTLGLSTQDVGETSLTEVAGWYRGGAETYIYEFAISNTSGDVREFVFKACTTFGLGQSLDKTIEEWVRRRTLLESHGVSAPELYSVGSGIILEEKIPFQIKEVVLKTQKIPQSILRSLIHYANALKDLNFDCVNPYQNLRSRGKDVVIIDFGTDLGAEKTNGNTNKEYSTILIQTLEEWGVQLSETEMSTIRNRGW